MARWRLLAGQYVGRAPDGQRRVYNQGDGQIIETDIDLSRFNSPGAMKFERLDEASAAARQSGTRVLSVGEESVKVAAPAGQVSQGFQTSGGGAGRGEDLGPAPDVRQENVSKEAAPKAEPPPPAAPAKAEAAKMDPTARAQQVQKLEGMNAQQLKQFAEEREIDLKGQTSKNEMLKTIKEAV